MEKDEIRSRACFVCGRSERDNPLHQIPLFEIGYVPVLICEPCQTEFNESGKKDLLAYIKDRHHFPF